MPDEWYLRWNPDPWLIGLIAAAVLLGHIRDASSSAVRWSAAIVFALLFISPLCALGSALFAFRVSHHLALSLVLAPMLAVLLKSRWTSSLSLSAVTAAQAAAFWVWHIPQVYEFAMRSHGAFWLMQISIVATATLWWAVLRRSSAMSAVASLLASMVSMGLLGALIVFAGRPLYAPHWVTAGQWGLTPMEDQQIAGLLMWVAAGAVYIVIAAGVLHRSLGRSATARAS